MARGKREIKRIENAASRHVTFTKRHRGLQKKARELSILCDSSVALIVFSSRGRVYEYSSSKINTIINRYLAYTESVDSSISSVVDHQNTDDSELTWLKQYSNLLERANRQMSGNDLENLSYAELEELEMKLEEGCKHIASCKLKKRVQQWNGGQVEEVESMEESNRERYQLQHLDLRGRKCIRSREMEVQPNQMYQSQEIALELMEENKKHIYQWNKVQEWQPERPEKLPQHARPLEIVGFHGLNDKECANCYEEVDTCLRLGSFTYETRKPSE